MEEHVITVTASQIFVASWTYTATCSCGEYSSGIRIAIRNAVSSAHNHVMTKVGDAFNPVTFYRQMQYAEENLLLEAQ